MVRSLPYDTAPVRKPGRVLVIAPVWNEARRIQKVVRDVPWQWVDEVLVVDDGSTDGSGEEAARVGAAVLRHPVNRGVGAAIRSGLDYALQHGYDFAVVISGSGKTPGAEVPLLLRPLFQGECDFAQGSRYLAGGKHLNHPLHRRFGTRAYSALFALLVASKVTDGSSGFRALRTSLLRDPRIRLHQDWLNRYELEPYLYFKAIRLGYRVKEVPITIRYPSKEDGPFTKMRQFVDWWSITKPLVLLRLGWRR